MTKDYKAGQSGRDYPLVWNFVQNVCHGLIAACLLAPPDAGVLSLIENGQLVEVLPQYRAAPMPVSLLYGNRRHVPKRVQVFMAWLAAIIQPYLQP